MSYSIFSDESGSWHLEDDVYVRSYVLIPTARIVPLNEHQSSLAGKKWTNSGDLITNDALCAELFDEVKVFVACTDIRQFNGKGYRVVNAVEQLDYDGLMSGLGFDLDMKKILVNQAKMHLFLRIYERQFAERLIAAARDSIQDFRVDEVVVEPPQFRNKDFEELLLALGINAPIRFSKKEDGDPGMVLADWTASGTRSALVANDRLHERGESFYRNRVHPARLCGSSEHPFPSYQFFPDGTDSIKARISDLNGLRP